MLPGMSDRAHTYESHLLWEGNRDGGGTSSYATYGRNYRVRVAGKPDLLGSANPRFRGDAGLHDPEDLMIAAVSSCHMLSFLALCAREHVAVVAYEDSATAVLRVEADGSGRFEQITLHPRVTLASAVDLDKLARLHDKAHAQCFIANSCSVPIAHQPSAVVAAAAE